MLSSHGECSLAPGRMSNFTSHLGNSMEHISAQDIALEAQQLVGACLTTSADCARKHTNTMIAASLNFPVLLSNAVQAISHPLLSSTSSLMNRMRILPTRLDILAQPE